MNLMYVFFQNHRGFGYDLFGGARADFAVFLQLCTRRVGLANSLLCRMLFMRKAVRFFGFRRAKSLLGLIWQAFGPG